MIFCVTLMRELFAGIRELMLFMIRIDGIECFFRFVILIVGIFLFSIVFIFAHSQSSLFTFFIVILELAQVFILRLFVI